MSNHKSKDDKITVVKYFKRKNFNLLYIKK